MIIGIDFDNTITCYDQAFCLAARDMGLVPHSISLHKRQVRELVRAQPQGETDWMRLQGRVYGFYMEHARLFPGFTEFTRRARAAGHDLKIISHKSKYGHFDPDHIDLIDAARQWMCCHGFFDDAVLGFHLEDVSFNPSRGDKLLEIARQECMAFIDDLPEVLLEANFPCHCRRILFAPQGEAESALETYSSWHQLTTVLLA